MSFKLTSATETKLVFESPKQGSSRTAWLVAFGFLLIALVLNRIDPNFEVVAFIIISWICLLLGCFVLAILIFQPQGSYVTPPSRIVFDKTQGVMEIFSENVSSKDVLTIPFSDLEKIDLDIQKKTNRNNDQVVTYHLYVELTSGGRWYLCTTWIQDEANQWLKQFEDVIDRSVKPKKTDNAALPKRWKLQSGVDQTLVTWTNDIGNRPVRLSVQTVVCLSILSGISYIITLRSPVREWLGAFAMVSPFLIVIGWLGIRGWRRLLRDMRTRFAIRLSNAGLEYYEFSKEGGALRNHVLLDFNLIENVRHTFAPTRGLPHDITVTRHDAKDPLTIYTDLSPFERQAVVMWLSNEISNRSTVSATAKN